MKMDRTGRGYLSHYRAFETRIWTAKSRLRGLGVPDSASSGGEWARGGRLGFPGGGGLELVEDIC